MAFNHPKHNFMGIKATPALLVGGFNPSERVGIRCISQLFQGTLLQLRVLNILVNFG